EGGPGRIVLPDSIWKGPLRILVMKLENALGNLGAAARSRADGVNDDLALREGLEQIQRRADTLSDGLRKICEKNEGRVTWAERVDSQVAVSSTPVDLSWTLKERLFE